MSDQQKALALVLRQEVGQGGGNTVENLLVGLAAGMAVVLFDSQENAQAWADSPGPPEDAPITRESLEVVPVVAVFELANWFQGKGLKDVVGMGVGGTVDVKGLRISMTRSGVPTTSVAWASFRRPATN